jgi:hypothetical protein
MGWVARGGRLLEESRRDCVEHAWLRMLTALPRLFEGDADVSLSFVQAGEIAERLADTDASMFARLGRGYSLILQGRVAGGMALLDEVMVSVTADEVAPMLAGIAYCQVIDLCQAAFDLRRAREWMRSDRPTISWPRSSGCAASSRRQRLPIAEPAWRDETPSRACRCSAWPRGDSTSRFRRSGARSTRRRIRSPGHTC